MNMLPKNVSNRDEMADSGFNQMFPQARNDVYFRRDQPRAPQPMNMQRVVPQRPPRVESAPIPINHGMGFQASIGTNQPAMLQGMPSSNIRQIDGNYYQTGLFPNRPIPKAQSPLIMSKPTPIFGGDRSNEGTFQPHPQQFQNQGQDMYYDMNDQDNRIGEVDSGSLGSDDDQPNVRQAYNPPKHNMNGYMKPPIREVVNDDEYPTESISRGNRSGHDSEKYQQQKSKPMQPSLHNRNSNSPQYPGYADNAMGYHSNMYPREHQHPPVHPQRREPPQVLYQEEDNEEENSYDEENQQDLSYENQHESYKGRDNRDDPKVSKNSRSQKIPKESDYLPSQKSKGKQKGRDRKKPSSKPSNSGHNPIETYEPQGGRYPPQSGYKGKSQSQFTNINLHDWNKQQGSRSIQHYLETESKETVNQLSRELIPNLVDISLNIFGNYVAQKMIEVGRHLSRSIPPVFEVDHGRGCSPYGDLLLQQLWLPCGAQTVRHHGDHRRSPDPVLRR
jgi:hypothetical protein